MAVIWRSLFERYCHLDTDKLLATNIDLYRRREGAAAQERRRRRAMKRLIAFLVFIVIAASPHCC